MPEGNGPSVYDFPQIYERLGLKLGNFGCIMLDVEPIPVSEHLGVNDPSWYYFSKNPMLKYVKGPVAETLAHATLLYGLTPDDRAGINQKVSVDELLSGLDLSSVTVDHVDAFPSQFGEPYSCIVAKLDAEGNDLEEANRRLRFLPHIDTFVKFKAHVTLAYVNVQDAEESIGLLNDALYGQTLKARGINYGGPIV